MPVTAIVPVLSDLSERDRFVLTRYFGLMGHRQHTLAEIAEELAEMEAEGRVMSRQRIHQLKDKAVRNAVTRLAELEEVASE